MKPSQTVGEPGRVICEHPFVKLLTAATLVTHELAPGWVVERWEALAQVGESLAIIEVKVRELE